MAAGELPNLTRNSIRIGSGVELDIFESLRNRAASLRVISTSNQLLHADVLVESAGRVDLNRDIGWEVELRVQSAGTVAAPDALGSRELVDVGGAGARAVKALLDAVACVFDLGKGKINLCYYSGDIKALDIADATASLDLEGGADARLGVDGSGKGTSKGAGEKESSRSDGGEEHV